MTKGVDLLPEETPIEFRLGKETNLVPDVVMSLGKARQDKNNPMILKQSKWHVDPASRVREDFVPNIRQYDVDDRMAGDLAFARMAPTVGEVMLLTKDGDLAYSVEQAQKAGLPVSLVSLTEGHTGISARLERAVDKVIHISLDMTQLTSRKEEQKIARQRSEEGKRARFKQIQREKRTAARLSAQDEEDEYAGFIPRGPSKEERWGQKRKARKKETRKVIAKRRGTYE